MEYKEYRLIEWSSDHGAQTQRCVVFRGANALPPDQLRGLNFKVRLEISKQIRRLRLKCPDIPAQNVLVIPAGGYGAEVWVSPETFKLLMRSFNDMMRGLAEHRLRQLAATA